MEYTHAYRQKHYHRNNKENEKPDRKQVLHGNNNASHDKNNNNQATVEQLTQQVYKLQCQLKEKEFKLKENHHINSKVKTELLQVSKTETEEYANNIEHYAKEFQDLNQKNQSLSHKLDEYQHKEQQQKEQLQALALGIEQKNENNLRKGETIQKLQHKNMSLQHEKQLLQQQLQSVRDNFYNDDDLMHHLCTKLEVDSCHSFKDLAQFVSHSKQCNEEYNGIKEELSERRNETERQKIEIQGYKKQLAIYEDKNNIEKGQLIHMESLRAENENLRNEIRILEESNSKLANDLIARSEQKMNLMTESLTRMQEEHQRIYASYDKQVEKVKRERKSYQQKYEHFKKEAKGFATKYEELNQKHCELEQQSAINQRNDDSVSGDYERRMSELEANNDALNEQLQSARHEIGELSLLRDNITKDGHKAHKEVHNLKNEIQLKERHITQIKHEKDTISAELTQLKASSGLMETMWNEFKHNQSQQNELLLNNLEQKIEHNQQKELHRYNEQIQDYQHQIYTLKQQISAQNMNKSQNEQISMLQLENDELTKHICELKQQIQMMDKSPQQSVDSSLIFIRNGDTLKQRTRELKQENMELHKELTQLKRDIETQAWEKTLSDQKLQNQIQVLDTKLCHSESRLEDKRLEIDELKKLSNGVEDKLEEIRNKYESAMQINAKMESQTTALTLYNQTLKANVQEHKEEIRALRQTMDAWYDKHGEASVYKQFDDASKSELVETLKQQNDDLRQKIEASQDTILSLKEEIAALKQTNHTLSDRYESNAKVTESRDSQIEQLRQTLAEIQNRENKLMKELTETKMHSQRYKIQCQQSQTQMIDIKEQSANLAEQIKYLQHQNTAEQQDKFEQFTNLTNKLEIVSKNAEQLKLTNKEMHKQIEYLKKAYSDLDSELTAKEDKLCELQNKLQHASLNVNTKYANDFEIISDKYKTLKEKYAKKEDAHLVISKKYEILKAHWESLNKDRSVAIERLKTEAQRVSESENKLSTLQVAIAQLNHERSRLEKGKQEYQEILGKLQLELNNKQMQLENVDEEKLKWKARTDKVTSQVIMNEAKVQEEMHVMKIKNDNLKQEVEKNMYEIEDLQNKNKQITESLNEWKLKFDEISEKYEFESGQHDNTLKKLNELRAIWDGETNLNQLVQVKQQMILELQSKLNEYNNMEEKYKEAMKENEQMKIEINRVQKVIHEQTNVQSSLKTRIDVQRSIISQQNQPNDNDNANHINITMQEYHQLQQQLNLLTELQNKYEIAQQQIMELNETLSQMRDKTDLDTSELVTNCNINANITENVPEHMQQLVAYVHKKEQSLRDLHGEYEGIKEENNALIRRIQQIEQSKIAMQASFKEAEAQFKMAQDTLMDAQNNTRSVEGHRDSLSRKLRNITAENAKLRVELFSLSSAANLVQEQLKTSAVALSTTTDKKQKLIQEMNNLRESLTSAEQQIMSLQKENTERQNYNDNLLNQFNTLKFTHQSLQEPSYNDDNNRMFDDKQSELMQSIQNERQKFQKEFAALHDKYKVAKSESIQIKAKSDAAQKQLEQIKTNHDTLNNECLGLKRTIAQLENNRHSMNIEKQQLSEQINKLQKKYFALFDEHNTLTQRYQSTNHEIGDMKLQKQTAFIERDLLDYKVEQLQGDKSNISLQLDKLKKAYFEQSNHLKAEHKDLCQNYKEASAQREALKMQTEQLLDEKQALQKMLTTYEQQLQHHEADQDSITFEVQHKYDGLMMQNSDLSSKLTAINIEHEELKASYERVSDKLTNAQLKIDELNLACNESKHNKKYSKDMIENIKDKFIDKKDEFEQLQMNYHEQENKIIKANHDLQTLLQSYNTIAAENEHLHSENQALYQQLQTEQIKKFLQNTKLQSDEIAEDKQSFNGITINLQSLIKRGKLLTEQCADLHTENHKLHTENKTLSQTISRLELEISSFNSNATIASEDINTVNDDSKTINTPDSKTVTLVNSSDHTVISSSHQEAILRELRHRNEQLMNQVRTLQHDLETDTELIDRLQKENGELRTKLSTFLHRQHNDDPQMIIAVDEHGEPWQDIIKGLRKQLQEARREIAQLCEETMGKTQHINDVESSNAQLIENIHSLEDEKKELTASLAVTPNTEPIDEEPEDKEADGQIVNMYTQTEQLCEQMESMITHIVSEQKTKEQLIKTLNDLELHLKQSKAVVMDIEQQKDKLSETNEIMERELSLLKRAKGQLSDHNEQLATEITNLQSIHFEQQQKISSQQQEISELQSLYQNIQSQLEIKEELNQQFQTDRQQIVSLFEAIDRRSSLSTIQPINKQNKLVDLGAFDYNDEHKMESMEPTMCFDFNLNAKEKKVDVLSKAKEFETLDIKHAKEFETMDIKHAKQFETLDIKHEIECLLNGYNKLTEKNTELQQAMDRNQKEYSIQNDFNSKFEEIKQLLVQQTQKKVAQDSFIAATSRNNNSSNDETVTTNKTNNGSANYGDSNPRKISLSANISPVLYSTAAPQNLNMTNPDLLNSSIQLESIMQQHQLLKEEEFEQLVQTKKELMVGMEALQKKYDSLSRDYANQTQKLSLMEQEYKHTSNQLESVQNEREALRSEIQNNKQLTDKLSKDFKAIGQERDHLYQKIKSLQTELETKEFDQKEQEYHRLKQEINELNDLNLKQSNQIELLQNNSHKYEQQAKESQHRYNSITNDFKTIKTKYERLNEEYDNLSSQQQKLYYKMNEIKQINRQKATQITSLENRLTNAMDECQKFESQISKNKLKYENEITDYQSKITELQLSLDSTKFEMVAKQSSDSNNHIDDLNEQLELLKNKYEHRAQQTKSHYSEKVTKMNEAVTKLSAARSKLQNQLMDKEDKHHQEMQDLKAQFDTMKIDKDHTDKKLSQLQTQLENAEKKNTALDDKKALLLENCNRRIESALKHKTTVDKELEQLQELHSTKIQGLDIRFEDLLSKYQQSVQENEIIKVAKEQHEMLVKEIDHLHAQLKQSRNEHKQLREKAQLHYTRRKEEWKKLKQLETVVNKKDEHIQELTQKEMKYMKEIDGYKNEKQSMNESELNSLCSSIEDIIHKLSNTFNNNDNENSNKDGDDYSLSNLFSFLQSIIISLTSIYTTSEIMMKQFDKNSADDDKYKEELMEIRRQLIELTKENEKMRFNELNTRSEIEEYTRKVNTMKKQMEETEKLLENERLNWKKQSNNDKIEFQELSDKCKIIEQQNTNLRSQIIQLNQESQELEDENNSLREERRRSLEGNTNEHLSERINLQRKIRIIREERDIEEKKLKENESKYNQLQLKLHQLQLQLESAQQRVDHLENNKQKLQQELDANNETISSFEAEKIALSKRNNELYDGNVALEEKNRKSQQEIGKFQVKSDRLRQQRDYAKTKYKELKAKFNSLEKQFRDLQSRWKQNNPNSVTSQTMPF